MGMLLSQSRLALFPSSLIEMNGVEFGLAQTGQGNRLAVLLPSGAAAGNEFDGSCSEFDGCTLMVCPLIPRNSAALRSHLPWLKPQLLGTRTSAGMGDRMGIATPGHVRAVRESGANVLPIFAQQSIREMQRTGRSPQQVMDDAMWGVFEQGWQGAMGSDADHLKTPEDIDACLAAGFTMFTLDPGQFVDEGLDERGFSLWMDKRTQYPAYLQPAATGLLGQVLDIEGFQLYLDEHALLKAMLKYGRAVEYVIALYRHLEKASSGRPFEVEISMDETELPTSPEEHVYIASLLQRMGVKWVSFAPRFVGRFEKGVDYIGDIRAFTEHAAIHAAIARQFGPYKLSLHSGSDKFSIYPSFMEKTHGSAHLKTAGTSYLEALRTIAIADMRLFEEIYSFARQHFENDKRSYHISAQLGKAPPPGSAHDGPELLDQFDAREILHVTFGSVLTARNASGGWLFYDRLMDILQAHREQYFDNITRHFRRHLEPFLAIPAAQEERL